MKRIYIFILFLFFLVFIFQSQFYRFKPTIEIPDLFKTELFQLGQKALLNNDVPVAALLTYNDSIIGRGYNSVKRDSNLGGHAEINAISNAYKIFGNRFAELDRKKLILYSTFEPCEMCKGALMHYNIQKIYFEKRKPVWDQIKITFKSILYDFKKQRLDAPAIQDSLFHLAG